MQPKSVAYCFVTKQLELFNAPQLQAQLSTQEQQRAGCLRQAAARKPYIAAHTLLMLLTKSLRTLAKYHWHLAYAANGRPVLIATSNGMTLSCSISHSSHAVAVLLAAAKVSCGVDVESWQRQAFKEHALLKVMAHNEQQQLLLLPEQQRIEQITALWTLKEALTKASTLPLRWLLRQDLALTLPLKPTPTLSLLCPRQGLWLARWGKVMLAVKVPQNTQVLTYRAELFAPVA